MTEADRIFLKFPPYIQEYIYSRGWSSLREIQLEAARVILESDDNLLLSSSTASGKTEAAFFPILASLAENPSDRESVEVLYIAPLKSLINDQFVRMEEVLEASAMDGAGPVATFFSIKLPMILPSVGICTFLTLTNTFKMFDQNLALTGGAPEGQTALPALDIFKSFYGRVGGQGVGQAKAVVFFLIVAALAAIQQWLTRRREVV